MLLDIRSALQNRLAAMQDNLAATAFEGEAFEPVQGSPYQTVKIVPTVTNPTMGDGFYREEGIFRVRLYYPIHTGVGSITEQAQKIRDWFRRGLTVSAGSSEVHVQRTPSISETTAIQDRLIVAIDIKYFSNVLL